MRKLWRSAFESFEARDSSLVTEADKSAGGRITVDGGRSFYMKNAEIETTVFEGAGGGGDVGVSGQVVNLDGASIFARASQGAGTHKTLDPAGGIHGKVHIQQDDIIIFIIHQHRDFCGILLGMDHCEMLF